MFRLPVPVVTVMVVLVVMAPVVMAAVMAPMLLCLGRGLRRRRRDHVGLDHQVAAVGLSCSSWKASPSAGVKISWLAPPPVQYRAEVDVGVDAEVVALVDHQVEPGTSSTASASFSLKPLVDGGPSGRCRHSALSRVPVARVEAERFCSCASFSVNVRGPGADAEAARSCRPIGATSPPGTAKLWSMATRVHAGVGSSLPSSRQLCAGAEFDGSCSSRLPNVVSAWLTAGSTAMSEVAASAAEMSLVLEFMEQGRGPQPARRCNPRRNQR